MEVWIFGNPDLPEDSLPIRLHSELMKRFPALSFRILDPLDEWQIPDKLEMIDTVRGIDHVRAFTSLDEFEGSPHVTMHDFDLGMQLRFLAKLKKLPPFIMYGVPDTFSVGQALRELTPMLDQRAR